MVEVALIVGLQAVVLSLFVFMFTRLDNKVDRLAGNLQDLRAEMHADSLSLRRELAEEFRAQRAEAAAQITAIASAITASRA